MAGGNSRCKVKASCQGIKVILKLTSCRHSAVLSGPGIEAEHCIMESIEGTVVLHPIAPLCQVNGLPVGKAQRISQG